MQSRRGRNTLIDSTFCTSSDDKLVTLTVQEKLDIVADNEPGDVFGIEADLEALVKSKQQDSQLVQIKVVSFDPLAIRPGLTTDMEWKYTV